MIWVRAEACRHRDKFDMEFENPPQVDFLELENLQRKWGKSLQSSVIVWLLLLTKFQNVDGNVFLSEYHP